MPILAASLAATSLLLILGHAATAQSATGDITGRVLWGSCIRAIPLPAQPVPPDVQGQPAQPVPAQINGLPAGAVLVAVQNTSISARTDETGRFTLSGVPAGQYMTIAAGPVGDATSAIAERPNVFVNGGQSLDVGTLSLGSTPTAGIACRFVPGLPGAGAAPQPGSSDATASPTDTSTP